MNQVAKTNPHSDTKQMILAFIRNHKKSSIVGLAEYLGISIDDTIAICKVLHEEKELKLYVRSDGLKGVRLFHDSMWQQQILL